MSLSLPKMTESEVALNNTLSTKITRLRVSDDVNLSVYASVPQPAKMMAAKLLMGDKTIECQFEMDQFQTWYQARLSGTDFNALPNNFQMAFLAAELDVMGDVINQMIGQRPVLSSFSPVDSLPQEHTLAFQFERDGFHFPIWITQGENIALHSLPEKEKDESEQISVPISLIVGSTELSDQELHTLGQGDVIFMNQNYLTESRAVLCLSSVPLWRCQFQENEFTVLYKETPTVMNEQDNHDIDAIPLNLTFEVGQQTLTLAELAQLQEGFTFVCQSDMESPVNIKVNGKAIGKGELVNVNDHIGVRVLKLNNTSQS